MNAGNGCINVNRNLNKRDISKILKESNLFQIQFHNRPNKETWENLNSHLFSKRPDVSLRLTQYDDNPLESIEFLKDIDNLKSLYLDFRDLENLETVGELHQLNVLILSETKRKNISLEPISNLKQLEYLHISGYTRDIERISELTELKELVLRSITVEDLDFLKQLSKLSKLRFLLGGTQNFKALIAIPELAYLELWQVRMLEDIEFISQLENLEYLKLDSLRNVKSLPQFEHNSKLSKIIMNTMKGLKNVESLKNLTNLEEFLYTSANNVSPEQLQVLKHCKKLRMALVGFGSDRKNKDFELFLASRNVVKYDWRKSKYQY